jgi:integrase
VRYRVLGKQRRLVLGDYGTRALTLSKGRERAAAERAKIREGVDRAVELRAVKNRPTDTVGALAEASEARVHRQGRFPETAEKQAPGRKRAKVGKAGVLCPISPTLAAVQKVRLLTGQRGGEIVNMRWADLDLDAGWWTIPAEISKNGQAAPRAAGTRRRRDHHGPGA